MCIKAEKQKCLQEVPAQDEMYEEKEEISVDVIKDKKDKSAIGKLAWKLTDFIKRDGTVKIRRSSRENRRTRKRVRLKLRTRDICQDGKEDFGKRNMPGKCARKHFSQLSEFERDPIIGMKTAGWSTGRVAGQLDRSECAVRNCWEQGTREGTHARKTRSGATRKTTRRDDRRIVRQAHVDPTVTRSTIRADVGVAIVPQTISKHLAEANLKSKHPFRALPLTPEHLQLRLQCCKA
ncbi:transposable element Tc1 transposase [Trichonephila clavipes]|nr:transposable element Tc1 transposase [Trichonephila clavipes]